MSLDRLPNNQNFLHPSYNSTNIHPNNRANAIISSASSTHNSLLSDGEYNRPAYLEPPPPTIHKKRRKTKTTDASPHVKFEHDPLLQRRQRQDVSRGWTPRLVAIVLLVNFGALLIGFNGSVLNPIMHDIWYDAKFNTASSRGFLVSSSAVGGFIGAMIGTKCTEKLGRKKTIILSDMLMGLGSIIMLLLPVSVFTLDCSRIIVGMGVGLAGMSIPIYLSEISPTDIRGGAIAIHAGSQNVGQLLGIGIVILLISTGVRARSHLYWRWLLSFECFPAFFHMFLMFWFPGSPRWLVQQKRIPEAVQVIVDTLGVDEEHARWKVRSMQKTYAQVSHPDLQLWGDGTTTNIMGGAAFREAIVLGSTLAIIQQFSGINTILNYSTTIFMDVGLSSDAQGAVYWTMLIVGLQLIFAIISIRVIDSYGRKPLLLYSLYGVTLSLLLLTGASYLTTFGAFSSGFGRDLPKWVVFGAMLCYIACYAPGLGPVPATINAEIFPTHLRGLGGSVFVCVTWMTSSIVTLVFPMIVSAAGMGTAFGISVVGCVFGIVFARKYVFETKGMDLEKIMRKFSRQLTKPDLVHFIQT